MSAGHERQVRVLSLNTERGWRGGENQVYLLQRGSVEINSAVQMLTCCRGGEALAHRLQQEGLPCLPLPVHGSVDLVFVRRLRRFIRRHGIDLVHAHASHAHSLGLLATRGLSVPLVVTRRVDFAVGAGLMGRFKYGDRVACFVAISQGVARVLRAGGVAQSRLRLIHSAIDPARFAVQPHAQLAGSFALPASSRVWVSVAALSAHKGHRYLLQAWQQVEAACPDAALVLIGDGELRQELEAQAEQLGLQRLRFAGYRKDVPALLRAADAFVMASVEEGLGTSLLDAACCHLPIVATRAGGIPELVADEQTGLLVEPAQAAELAQALIRVHQDRDLAQRLADAAHHQAASFHYHSMVRSYHDLYHELVDSDSQKEGSV